MSNSNKVKEFHVRFGHIVNNEYSNEYILNNNKLMMARIGFQIEEYNELLQAYKDNNKGEILDAIIDSEYYLHGYCHILGISNETERISYKLYENKHVKYNENGIPIIDKLIKSYYKMITQLTEYMNNPNKLYIIELIKKMLSSLHTMACYMKVKEYNEAFNDVHVCNMTKVCETEDEAIATCNQYSQDSEKRYDPFYEKSTKGNYYVVKNKLDNKALKSIKWRPVDLNKYVQ